MLEAAPPAGDMSHPSVPDLVLYQDVLGGNRVSGDMGGGQFDVSSSAQSFFLSAPDFANRIMLNRSHQVRSLSFPMAQWRDVIDEATDGGFSFERAGIYGGTLSSPLLQTTFRSLWAICDQEGAPSRLLARAAGCEILAELCRLGGQPIKVGRGGLAPWAKHRCVDMMKARLAEDISLDDLANETRLSPFHFARMFKQTVGMPPQAYLTQLRIERACELLELTEVPISTIATKVGYSSEKVLARVFRRHRGSTLSDYRRAFRGESRYDVKGSEILRSVAQSPEN
ncbi:AraC family transcriptional regulator [Aliirhizobium terrae]|uniref:AraC family transcriptional regulator n=1 Tax=Terrirhizobium terrae TaxID=2926709 RepID=UPI00336A41E4